MTNPVYVKSYKSPAYNQKEILRYAGVKSEEQSIIALISECIKELEGKLSFQVCYREFPVEISGNKVELGFTSATSKALAANLNGCHSYILFAASVGVEMDRLIAKYSALSPTKALIFQAIGAERIESLCDLFNNEVKEQYTNVKPRFSPGYGDFSIEYQREIFTVLDCAKRIGVTLNESLLMSPSKSVTAIIGLGGDRACKIETCENCSKSDCEFRRE